MLFTTREPGVHFGQQIELLPLTEADRDALVAAWIPGQAAALQRRLASDDRLGELGVTPHVAMNTKRSGGSAIDGRTSRHPGYSISQLIRKRFEEIVGWEKTVGGFRRTKLRGEEADRDSRFFWRLVR